MSADLYLYRLDETLETSTARARLARCEFSYYGDDDDDPRDDEGFIVQGDVRGLPSEEYWALYQQIYSGPRQWIGQVSWLKAGLDGDPTRWIPDAVWGVATLVPEDAPRRLTPAVATAIMVEMNRPNRSWYKTHVTYREGRFRRYRTRGVARRQHVRKWLNENMGGLVVSTSE